MSNIISIINHKGGVGKTTVTANLSKALSLKGAKVLLVDFDPQANLTAYLDAEEKEKNISHAIFQNEALPIYSIGDNLDIVPGSLHLAMAENQFAGDINAFVILKAKLAAIQGYDFILIDCPPSLGFFTLNALNTSTDIIIPCEASKLATDGLASIYQIIDKVKSFQNPNLQLLGILISNFKPLRVEKAFAEGMKEHYQQQMFDTVIRSYKHYRESSANQETIFEDDSATKAQEDFNQLAQEIYEKTSVCQ